MKTPMFIEISAIISRAAFNPSLLPTALCVASAITFTVPIDELPEAIHNMFSGNAEQKKPAPEIGDRLSETERQIMNCVHQMSPKEQEAFLAWLQASQGRG